MPAYLARDTHVSRPSSVRITPEIRAYHVRDTLAFFVCVWWLMLVVRFYRKCLKMLYDVCKNIWDIFTAR